MNPSFKRMSKVISRSDSAPIISEFAMHQSSRYLERRILCIGKKAATTVTIFVNTQRLSWTEAHCFELVTFPFYTKMKIFPVGFVHWNMEIGIFQI